MQGPPERPPALQAVRRGRRLPAIPVFLAFLAIPAIPSSIRRRGSNEAETGLRGPIGLSLVLSKKFSTVWAKTLAKQAFRRTQAISRA
eukprot:360879-Chlamydomonas_euryale.AAC.3